MPDLIERDFTAERLDERRCGDITYIRAAGTWLFPASAIDIRSRRVVGPVDGHPHADLAGHQRAPGRGCRPGRRRHRSDLPCGPRVPYTSAAFAEACDRHGIRSSTGRIASSYDNAPAESLWQSLKRESLHGTPTTTAARIRLEVFRRLTYHNTRRRHSALGYL
ncbi:hypothetical protein GCM10009663_71760 [Kitasatospora arboriphila]|uniref:Integrase catalytic domain-containing protein n=1 Tax=Kitasatospora arboriphila TaxID=258052 RepID=A0ABN1U5H4_9ACTN